MKHSALLPALVFGAVYLYVTTGSVFAGGPESTTAGAPESKRPPAQLRPEVSINKRKASATRIIAKLKLPDDQPQMARATARLEALGLQVAERPKVKSIKGLLLLVPDGKTGITELSAKDLRAKIDALQESGLFEYVQPDYIQTIQQSPSDTAFIDGTLWGLRNTGQNGGTNGIDINVVPAWTLTTGIASVVVAIIDTGIRYTHQELRNRIWINSAEIQGNGVDDDNNGYIDDIFGINAINDTGNPLDDNGHGTHVAGTVAASANNGQPHIGIAYNVRLMPLKFLDAEGSGYTLDAVKCIDYAISKGAHVLNNSWGGGDSQPVLEEVIRAANTAGILFIAAAGNGGLNTDGNPHYPSSYNVPNIVAVAAIDKTGALASFSNFGSASVHLGAPGAGIYSSIASSDNSYDVYDGTSMAAPHVSGVAALVKSYYNNAPLEEIKNRILVTRQLPSMAGRTKTSGILDAHRALTVMPDGTLELYAAAGVSELAAGQQASFFVEVKDLMPVRGATVTGKLVPGPSRPFLDDGVAPDAVANDGIYSGTLAVPAVTPTVNFEISAVAPNSTPASATVPFPVYMPAPNDHFANRIAIQPGTMETAGHNKNTTAEVNEPIKPDGAGERSVWWEWAPAAAGNATVSTKDSDFDTTLAVYRSTASKPELGTLELVAENDDVDDMTSAVTFSVVVGERYYIQVNGYLGAEGAIHLAFPPAAPLTSSVSKATK